MFQKLLIVMEWIVSAIVSATTFFASQCGTADQLCCLKYVSGFPPTTRYRRRHLLLDRSQAGYCCAQALTVTNDARVLPGDFLEVADRLFDFRLWNQCSSIARCLLFCFCVSLRFFR